MEILNSNSLARVMEHCRDYPGYQSVIMVNGSRRLREFMNSMKELLRNEECDDISSISRAGIIKFKNGSYIRPIPSDSGARGLCAHEVLYDEGIVDELAAKVKKVIYHCREDKPVTLDEFLDGFKIIS